MVLAAALGLGANAAGNMVVTVDVIGLNTLVTGARKSKKPVNVDLHELSSFPAGSRRR